MAQPLTAKLILVEGADDLHPTIPLHQKDIVIGRACGCEITWSSLQISRRHATLEYLNQKWFIRDCSTNGLSVGSEKLVKGVLRELKHNELIHFIPTGTLVYRFEYSTPDIAQSATASTSTTASHSTSVKPKPNPPATVITVEEDDDDDIMDLIDASSNHSESLLSISGQLDEFFDPMNMSLSSETNFPDESPNNLPKSKTPNAKRSIPAEDLLESGANINNRKRRKDRGNLEMDLFEKAKETERKCNEEALLREISLSLSNFERQITNSTPSNAKKPKVAASTKASYGIAGPVDPTELTADSIISCEDLQKLRSHCLLMYNKYKFAEAENLTLQMEKTIEKEEYLRRASDAQSKTEAHKEELFKKIVEALEQEFGCCICNEIFVHPTVVDCGHTFCDYCIVEWMRKKPECPICRKYLRNPTKHVEMDNFLVKIHQMLSEEIRTKREQAIRERKDCKDKAATRAAAEARGRRNALPNDYFPLPDALGAMQLPFDLLAELQGTFDAHPWPVPPAAHSASNGATAAQQRRTSARIQGRNQPAGAGPVARGRRGRQQNRQAVIDEMMGGLNNVVIPPNRRNEEPPAVGGMMDPNQMGPRPPGPEPQPGTSRAPPGGGGLSSLFGFGSNVGLQLPSMRSTSGAMSRVTNFFAPVGMYSFGGMGGVPRPTDSSNANANAAPGPSAGRTNNHNHPAPPVGMGVINPLDLDVYLVD